jgi:hypothetical protein
MTKDDNTIREKIIKGLEITHKKNHSTTTLAFPITLCSLSVAITI